MEKGSGESRLQGGRSIRFFGEQKREGTGKGLEGGGTGVRVRKAQPAQHAAPPGM